MKNIVAELGMMTTRYKKRFNAVIRQINTIKRVYFSINNWEEPVELYEYYLTYNNITYLELLTKHSP